MKTQIHLLGYASAVGGVRPECSQGPQVLRQVQALNQPEFSWDAVFEAEPGFVADRVDEVRRLCLLLAARTAELTHQRELFIVMGGDHTAAIGTWSGVGTALPGPLGLIWVDAHMDSHTPETSQSGRLHGMPLAALLGYGDPRLTQVLSPKPKLHPEHLCLIGVRSYEEGEALLLKKLGVRVYFMEEVKRRGLQAVFQEALMRVRQGTVGYGLSLDVDSLDPQEAPGVDVPEPDGLSLDALVAALREQARDPRLLGVEVVEFNPQRDHAQRTEKAVVALIQAVGCPHVER